MISGLDLTVWYFSIPSVLHEIPVVCLWEIFIWLVLILFEVLSEDCSLLAARLSDQQLGKVQQSNLLGGKTMFL